MTAAVPEATLSISSFSSFCPPPPPTFYGCDLAATLRCDRLPPCSLARSSARTLLHPSSSSSSSLSHSFAPSPPFSSSPVPPSLLRCDRLIQSRSHLLLLFDTCATCFPLVVFFPLALACCPPSSLPLPDSFFPLFSTPMFVSPACSLI